MSEGETSEGEMSYNRFFYKKCFFVHPFIQNFCLSYPDSIDLCWDYSYFDDSTRCSLQDQHSLKTHPILCKKDNEDCASTWNSPR